MAMPRLIRFLKWSLAAALVAAVALVVLLPKRTGIEGYTDRTEPVPMKTTTDAMLRTQFLDAAKGVPRAAYESLARYIFEGFVHYRTTDGAYANYPGQPSANGRKSDGIEGFARVFPVAGAWLASGHPDQIDVDGRKVLLSQIFADGLLAGTNPASPAYWGDITDYNQRLVETSDIGLGLWLSRDSIWKRLDRQQRAQVTKWLGHAIEVETYDGNWELFPLVAYHALKAVGADTTGLDERARTRYEHFKTSYRGEGWFFDPPHGFDFYNAWSIHYQLFWLDQLDPALDPRFIRSASADFNRFFKHLFGPKAYPMLGRSSCYRMAAATPLILATHLAPDAVSAGQALRAMDLGWSYFLERGAMADGAVTQGFCGTNLEIVANYSGPASCLWATRGLVAALHLDASTRLLDAPREKLPVETADFEVSSSITGWTLKGNQSSGDVAIVIPKNPSGPGPKLKSYGTPIQLAQWLLHKPLRPDNSAALYQRREYSTANQVVACEAAR